MAKVSPCGIIWVIRFTSHTRSSIGLLNTTISPNCGWVKPGKRKYFQWFCSSAIRSGRIHVNTLSNGISAQRFGSHPPYANLFIHKRSPQSKVGSILPDGTTHGLPTAIRINTQTKTSRIVPFRIRILFFLSDIYLYLYVC